VLEVDDLAAFGILGSDPGKVRISEESSFSTTKSVSHFA
jgi:hypothetical protein